ncbi:arginine-ornithine antiporter [Periweissella cryptocerci]|uniref:Arginine-ornithine antiporter n=1 Tax=Periweissella cryptocerci TaxID=2506420 RepID=A0A4P6YUZ9_9LACO|nr:arginine-ornithine antiporter [Periweissella cryptocerci]QBO36629.1 arginine-ornithine antiporter [Periweissella cryptocerci]
MDNKKGISLIALVALVVSSSIGAGIFALISDVASVAAPGAVIIAWIIVGFGVLMLALSLSNLVEKRPELEGVFTYAEEGFGTFAGFISGWGYWLSAWLGNVAFATILMSSIGYFFPIFKTGQNIWAILGASIIAWALTFFVNKGVESAAVLNTVVTVCKMIPLFAFIVVGIFLFKGHIFTAMFWSNVTTSFHFGDVMTQVKGCIMVMMWVFVGVEGAAMMSSRAKKKSDASKATIIGLLSLLLIYVLASLLPYGYMTQTQLADLNQPAMVYLFESMVGPVGGVVISIGLIISILGSWLAWTMLPSETILLMSKRQLLPKSWGKTNKAKAPSFALFVTQALIQIFLFSLLFTSQAYNFAYSLCTAAIIVTYAFVGAYQIKYSWDNKLKQPDYKRQMVYGFIALVFEIVGICLAGVQFLLLCLIAYVPGIYFYAKARKECGDNAHGLTSSEKVVAVIITIGAIIGIVLLVLGKINV